MSLPPDTHIHTPLCQHAVGAPADYVQAAARNGIPQICFTDHAPAPDGYDPESRMALDQFPEYQAMVAEAADTASIPVRFGIEADYYPGAPTFLDPWLERQSFDLVLGSVHFIGDWGFDNPKNLARWDQADPEQIWSEYFRLIALLADTRLFDVVGHLDLPKKFGHRLPEPRVRELAQPALDRIAAADMAIELNTGGLRKPAREIYPTPTLLELACERDIPIAFGSDSHAPEEVGYAFEQAVALARSAGYTQAARFRQRRRTLVPL